MGEVEEIDHIKEPPHNPTASTLTCKEYLKWDMRMQHTLKYQAVKYYNKEIIKNLNATQERDCYKILFELNKK